MAAVTVYGDFWAQEKIVHCFHFFTFCLPWSHGTRCHGLSLFECWVSIQLFHSALLPSSRSSLVPLHFCHLSGIICISEIVDISPSNLDSSLWVIQPGISHDVLCIEVNKQGNNIQPWRTFPILNQSIVPWASLISQLVKDPPAMQETLVRFLGQEDPLEKGKATYSGILASRIPWTV